MVKDVIRTDNFLRQLKKIDNSFIDRVEKLIIKIIEDPEIGKPMRYERKGTREVYMPPFRLNYAYDHVKDILIFLDIYHKSKQ